ncbi:tRNA (adenine(58)-N(1))-methyltransferase catalytic subunit trm61 [Penicillium angulare]|uniref:tRNA (adenine(58)-N(1))-methyltransferase catalytic subunit TRM61 n=1 Tax=Penicillium angulare TaxID=116970 RepID=A0A9W9FZJ6_9EURO|nr:tRNA (adenine(58)-N(1))-methyltransferase catalytic subunit trm61 [Penicillium angulare]
MPSPFLTPGTTAQPNDITLLHLRRDQALPTILRDYDEDNMGYKEGKVANTRFGSFPHSTMINRPWGSQIAASKVDTGSRGRRGNPAKRKADDLDESGATTTGAEEDTPSAKKPVAAASGFLHMMYPTPEAWTLSLPHRTQVVYAPDYSYILHRLRVRPGDTIIEAGAGSGSFTHAAVRAVFNGYPEEPQTKKQRLGKVCSFEFHEQRAGRVREEISEHGLDGLVQVTHRDVYQDAFNVGDPKTGPSPKANAIFLDLPAPWLALKHLVRKPESGESPLDPSTTTHICTFSPCLEQVERTIRTMRKLSWLNISMVEVQCRRIDVRRERIGLDATGIRGATVFPTTVEEAADKLWVDEQRAKVSRTAAKVKHGAEESNGEDDTFVLPESLREKPAAPSYSLGRLVHRSESDIKTHTSYLVFAMLPREWSEEDEQKCRQRYPSNKVEDPEESGKSKKQIKRELRAKFEQAEKAKKATEQQAPEGNVEAS